MTPRCSYHNCPNPGTVYVGTNPACDSQMEWLCGRHDAQWQRVQDHRREQEAMDAAIAYLDPNWQNGGA